MKHRQLGENGFSLSEIGLGCWQLGADWGTEIDKNQAFNILDKAVNNGINFLDTADVYGDGRSETFIGMFLKETSHNVKVATKFGRSANVYPNNYSKHTLQQCVENSLKRLQVDRIDLLQLHCVPTEILKEGTIFNWLRALQQEGKIAKFGASVESVEEGLICIEQEGIQSLQVIFNVFRQKLVKQLLPQAAKKGIGIIARLPLASGLLSGKFNMDTEFAVDDHRHYNRNGDAFNVGETFAGLPFKTGVTLSKELEDLCPNNLSLAELSLRWILDHKEVTTIIPGASTALQVSQNANSSSLPPLSTTLTKNLSQFYNEKVHKHIRGVY